jgi:uncharacterized protein YyaL (SSP411 family)
MDEQWLTLSKQLTDYTFTNFFDSDKSMFYFTSKEDPALVARTFEYRDNVIAASNSIMAKNLYKLSHYYDETNYANTARQMLKNVTKEMEQYPSGFSNWLDLLENYQDNYFEIVVVGKNASEKINEINQYYIPNKLVAGSTKGGNSPLLEGRYVEGETLIYVCVNNACKLPVRETNKAIESLKSF